MNLDRNRIQAIGYLCYLAERRYLNLDTKDGLDIYLNNYQNCRIYLDEYEIEEVDLRVRFDTNWLVKRFMVKE